MTAYTADGTPITFRDDEWEDLRPVPGNAPRDAELVLRDRGTFRVVGRSIPIAGCEAPATAWFRDE